MTDWASCLAGVFPSGRGGRGGGPILISFHPPPGPDLISSSGTSAGVNKNNGYQGEVKAGGGGAEGRGAFNNSAQPQQSGVVTLEVSILEGEAPLSPGACSGGATPWTFRTFARSYLRVYIG